MDLHIKLDTKNKNNITTDNIQFKKMTLIYNAINEGWSVKMRNNSYIFSKDHNDDKEIFSDEYLTTFIKENFDMNKIVV
jgi:hypothetical protein